MMNLDVFNKLQIFVRDAMPGEWLDYADELQDAAELLWQDRDNGMRIGIIQDPANNIINNLPSFSCISRPYILLTAFSLENLLKGLLVMQNPTHINTGQLSKVLKSHNLTALANQVGGLTLSTSEQRIVSIAERALPYWGRYPIPLRYEELDQEEAATSEYRLTFNALHDRLAQQIYDGIKDGWDSEVGPLGYKYRSRRYGIIDPHENMLPIPSNKLSSP